MSEHRIRLARAWKQRGAHFQPRRVDLPIVWDSADLQDPFELIRPFHWPRIDPATQAVDLELIDVPGLLTVQLDGRTMFRASAKDEGPIQVAFEGEICCRCELVLAVDLARAAQVRPWGVIALVIRGRAT